MFSAENLQIRKVIPNVFISVSFLSLKKSIEGVEEKAQRAENLLYMTGSIPNTIWLPEHY